MNKTKLDATIEATASTELSEGGVSESQVNKAYAGDEEELNRGKRREVHRAWVWLVRSLGIGAIVTLVVVLWHLLIWESWRWLKPEEVEYLATVFVSALIGYMARSVQKFI